MSRLPVVPVYVCRVCKCGGDECRLEDGEKCVWVNDACDLCSNPRCMLEAAKAKRRELLALRDERRAIVKPIADRVRASNAELRQKLAKRRARVSRQSAKFRGKG